jgi:phospholipase C
MLKTSLGDGSRLVSNLQLELMEVNGFVLLQTTLVLADSHDYYPDDEPFQYYQSTANHHHLPPTSVAMIGHTDQANHQYDLSDFWAAAQAGNMPAVSFIKAPTSQDGHPIDSDPTDEQNFLVNTINRLQQIPEWNSTAIIITYDDSGGWYDHVLSPIVSQSSDPKSDSLIGNTGLCGLAPCCIAVSGSVTDPYT